MTGFVLSPRTAQRLKEVLAVIPGAGSARFRPNYAAKVVTHVRITDGFSGISVTPLVGYYTGVPSNWISEDEEWEEYDDCLVLSPNGETLNIDDRYLAVRVGDLEDDTEVVAVYMVQQVGSSSSLTTISASTIGDTTLTGTLANILGAIVISAPGEFQFFGALGWAVTWGFGQTDPVVGESISIRLRDTTNSIDIMVERSVVGKYIVYPGEQAETAFTWLYEFGIGLTYPLSVRLQAKCGSWGSNPQGVVTAFVTPSAPETRLSAVQLS